jgi:hypothetical protein
MMIGQQIFQQDPYRVSAVGDFHQCDYDISNFLGSESGDRFHDLTEIIDHTETDVTAIDGENLQHAFFQMLGAIVVATEVGCDQFLHRLEAKGFEDRLSPGTARDHRLERSGPPVWTLWNVFAHQQHLARSPL